jgi:hypothetical protein
MEELWNKQGLFLIINLIMQIQIKIKVQKVFKVLPSLNLI